MSAAEIELRLHPALHATVERLGRREFESGVESGLRAYIHRLGFGSEPSVRAVVGGDRAVAVWVGGTMLAYPPSFLLRACGSESRRRTCGTRRREPPSRVVTRTSG